MLAAANQCMGTILTGPACTGKTEMVRHLARSVGVACFELNCSLGIDQLTTNRVFKAVAATGAWCCFDSLDLMDPQVLSVVAQQVQGLQRALMVGARNIRIDGDLVLLGGVCSIFATMRPSGSVGSLLPANLASSLRVCAVSAPHEQAIAKVWFWAIGFRACDRMAQQAVAVLRACRELIVRSYLDFGLRKLRSIVDTCAILRPASASQPEEALLHRSLQAVLLPMLVETEEPLLGEILEHVFPKLPPVLRKEPAPELKAKLEELMTSERLDVVPHQLEKAVQLWHTLSSQPGVIMMGAPVSGKSTLLRWLAAAVEQLQLQSCRTVSIQILNPKAVETASLLGRGAGGSNQLLEGVLANIVRSASVSCHADPNRRDWIVCDGPIDPVWVESLSTVLDDNRKLCLPDGVFAHPSPCVAVSSPRRSPTVADWSAFTTGRCLVVPWFPSLSCAASCPALLQCIALCCLAFRPKLDWRQCCRRIRSLRSKHEPCF